ncbi:MAG: hypothetical protein NTW32_26940 [Chloroflexi bacterium]|nr:hypothetical protein [Chloroflexota bacterium]
MEGVNVENLDQNLYDISWLIGKPCASPCWNGLEPGVTPRKVSTETAKKLPFVNSESFRTSNKYGMQSAWLLCKEPTNLTCVNMFFDNGILESLWLTPSYEITFDEAVKKLGTPDGFLVKPMYPNAGGCSLDVIWIKQRLILRHIEGVIGLFDFRTDLCTKVRQNNGKLPSGIRVEGVIINNPSEMESIFEKDIIQIWKGFMQD